MTKTSATFALLRYIILKPVELERNVLRSCERPFGILFGPINIYALAGFHEYCTARTNLTRQAMYV